MTDQPPRDDLPLMPEPVPAATDTAEPSTVLPAPEPLDGSPGPDIATTADAPPPPVAMAEAAPVAPADPLAAVTRAPDPAASQSDPAVFSPDPEPRTDWSRPEFAPSRPTSEWYEPVAPVAPTAAATGSGPASREPRRGIGIGALVAATLASAVLASGGTVVALNAAGVFDETAAASAQPSTQPASTSIPVTIDESSATIDVAAKAGPAVVRITTEDVPQDQLSIPESGVGSGVIYDSDGWILTNRHVVAGADTLTVELSDGRQLDGEIYGIDTLTDLAIVKVDATGLPTAAIGDSDALKVGQLTIAIGSPLGTYSNTVTSGILSARGRTIEVDGGRLSNLLQTDTAINPGNSGGPLLDAGGNVIGINTAIATSAEGIGFAIPVNLAKPIMEQAVAGEPLARPYIGVRFETIDVQVAEREDLDVTDGALIADTATDPTGQSVPGVVPGGPADEAGIEEGDIVTAIEGQALDGEHPLDAVVSQYSPGEVVTLEVLRDGEELSLEVTLGTRPPDL
jgi:S1-C subfamily serine protease